MKRLLTALALGAVLVGPAVAPTPAFAQNVNPGRGQNGSPGGGNPGGGGAVDPAATPELGSLLLFGSGAAGFAGYAWRRVRAGQVDTRNAAPDEAPAP